MRIADRVLAVLLLLGAVGHTFGAIQAYSHQPVSLLWALCASVLVALLGALNLLRAGRPADRALAWIAAAGTACWLVAAVAFGVVIRRPTDPRVVVFVVVCAGLIAFSLQTALRPSPSGGGLRASGP